MVSSKPSGREEPILKCPRAEGAQCKACSALFPRSTACTKDGATACESLQAPVNGQCIACDNSEYETLDGQSRAACSCAALNDRPKTAQGPAYHARRSTSRQSAALLPQSHVLAASRTIPPTRPNVSVKMTRLSASTPGDLFSKSWWRVVPYALLALVPSLVRQPAQLEAPRHAKRHSSRTRWGCARARAVNSKTRAAVSNIIWRMTVAEQVSLLVRLHRLLGTRQPNFDLRRSVFALVSGRLRAQRRSLR